MKFLLCLLSSLCCFLYANAADASIQAPNKIILGTTTLDITCSVTSATSLKRIYSLTLLRNNSNTASVLTVIGFIDSDVDGATIKNDADLQSRASISGTVASPSTAQLKLSVSASSTKCTDAVSYQCKVVALTTGDNTDTYLKDKDIKVEVRPSSTADIVVHSGSSSISDSKPYKYTPGTVVTLTCKGSVGNPAKLHRWCKKGVNDQGFTGYPNSAHINQEVTLVYQPATCDYQRTSSLTYNITTQDTKIEFLCEDGTDSLCGDGLFTKQVEIENIVEDDNPGTGGQSGETADASSGGIIAGAVIGALAAVILIALIIYFVVFRGRNSGETYDTKEDGSPGGPAHTEGPVYSVPDKKRDRSYKPSSDQPPAVPSTEPRKELHYADLDIATRPPGVPPPKKDSEPPTEYASNRFVHENKGLDEPHESRPRDSPDERGHTNKMMYDDDYDNNLDGDITPNRGGGHPSEGFGSAV